MNQHKTAPTNSTAYPIAGLTRRIAAMVYDLFLLAAIVMAYALTVITPLRFAFYGMPSSDSSWVGFPLMVNIALMTGLAFILCGYFFICWRKQGQSMGMKAWRLKLQQSSGELASVSQCWQRSLLAPVSLAFFGLGYLWCLIAPNRGCVHDRLTGTQVVTLPKSK